MLHQDLRPDNIMVDKTGTVKIIDFGSTRINGVAEAEPSGLNDDILGTLQYTAPEYFLGEGATTRSDLFSLGVITYQMLTGKLPYGAQAAQARTRAQFGKLRYRPAAHGAREIPVWVDGTLEIGSSGVYVGKDSIRRYLYSLSGGKQGPLEGVLFEHFQLQPIVTVEPDGQSAKARWRSLLMTGVYGEASGGNWGEGTYENEYVKQDGVWKIRTLHWYTTFIAPYKGGWLSVDRCRDRYGTPSRRSRPRTARRSHPRRTRRGRARAPRGRSPA